MRREASGRDAARISSIEAALGVLRAGGGSAIPGVLPELRELLDAESVIVYGVRQRVSGYAVERWDVAGTLAVPRTRELIDALFASDRADPVFYDPLRPEAGIRDRVFEATEWIEATSRGAWKTSRAYREFFEPLRMFEHRQLRALVCEGPVLLGWFGMIHPETTTPRQHALLTALVPAMRRRLSIERRLEASSRDSGALHLALEQIGAAAYVISAGAAIHVANAMGHALLASHRSDVAAALADTLARRANALVFELVPIEEANAPASWLAILRSAPRDVRIDAAVGACATGWGLTPRQRQVLELVARGHANATIAARLGISGRTVELHVSALLDRAGVESRAALVVRVLAG